MRRLLAAGLALSAVPVGAVLLGHPAQAVPAGYDEVATTAIVEGVSYAGDVGASGGLATLDGGSARLVASLDGSPSGHVVAAPYEPGGLVRTVVGQVNTNAGQQVLSVPDAEAGSPGGRAHDSVAAVPPTSAGPVAAEGGSATADAAPHRVAGTAAGTRLEVAGVVSARASTSALQLDVDAAGGTVHQVARGAVGSLDVAGVLELRDVVGSVEISASGDAHTATQSLTVGSASVAGQEVGIDNDGVHAVGTPVVPGQTLEQATQQADAVLAQAGVSVRTVGGRASHDARSAVADTGGLLVTVTTPGLPVGGVAGNAFSVLVGRATLTELDALPTPTGLPACVCPAAVPALPPTTTTTFVPGTPGVLPGTSGGPAPALAPPGPASYVLAGRRVTARAAVIAFAVWQMLSLGTPTLYALVERRRRLA